MGEGGKCFVSRWNIEIVHVLCNAFACYKTKNQLCFTLFQPSMWTLSYHYINGALCCHFQKSIQHLVKIPFFIPQEHSTVHSSLLMENMGDGARSATCALNHQLSFKHNAAGCFVVHLQHFFFFFFSTGASARHTAVSITHCPMSRWLDWHDTNYPATKELCSASVVAMSKGTGDSFRMSRDVHRVELPPAS